METISISKLKAQLSGEIKKVRKGTRITVLDHNHPVAELVPIKNEDSLFLREVEEVYECKKLTPLIDGELDRFLEEERSERW